MDTTLGSYAFDGAKAKFDAAVVDKLQAAGLIVFAKDNLSVSKACAKSETQTAKRDRSLEVRKVGELLQVGLQKEVK